MGGLLSSQLTFEWPNLVSSAREDFVVTHSNAQAFRMVDSWPHWPVHGVLVVGPAGSGKTHLAKLWQDKSNAKWLESERDVEQAASSSGTSFVVEIEDAQSIPETPLFHLINRAILGEIYLLLTAPDDISFENLRLRDLRSRLRALPHISIEPPDDDLLRALLTKQFTDRQIEVSGDVIDFVLQRIERSASGVQRTAEQLDILALSEGRRLSKQNVSRYLRGGQEGDDVSQHPALNFNA